MKLFTGLDQIVKYDEPLAKHCWMGLGGPAKYFITPGNREELAEVVKRCRENNLAMQVLGAGANLLVLSKRVDAAVIRLSPESFTQIEIDGTKVRAAAGADLLPHITQQDLASMVGTSRVVVNRSLRVMEEKKAIRLERRHIMITDEEALKRLVR